MTPYPLPRPSAAEIRARLAAEAALPSRIRFVALLLAGLAGAAVTASLALTEPDLPARTRAAFWVLTAMGLAWAAFAAWVLARRRTLLAGHRVVAGGMAVTFGTVFTAAALLLELWPAAGVGVLMVIAAATLLRHARRRVAELGQRRLELEHRLHEPGATS